MPIIKALHDKSLPEIGVKPGWFCQAGGCSIWLQVITVWKDMLECVARDPENGTTLIIHKPFLSGTDCFCETEPESDFIALAFNERVKNFFDKFHPEPEAMTARGLRQQAIHHEFWGKK